MRRLAIAILAAAVTSVVAGPAFAGKSQTGSGGQGATGPTGTFSIVLVQDANGTGSLNYGDVITFNVTSTASYPMVKLTCYQNGDWVTNQTVGFYPGWRWSRDFPLSSYKWPSGAADCTANLYYQTRKGDQTLATINFPVDA